MTSNKTGPSMAVVMSTYNGERFLGQQIDSILEQSGVSVDLYVRDDASTDGTGDILRYYEGRYDNVHVEFGESLGVGNSFMKALDQIPDGYDYYGFSDQDDIWMTDKCIAAVEKLRETGKVLYASNQECVDAEGNTLGLRYGPEDHIHVQPVEIVFLNMLAGCTFVFTRDLAERLREKPFSDDLLRVRIHDVVVAAAASLCGGICYDEASHMKYRQHEDNVVGAAQTTRLDDIKTKVKKAFDRSERNGRSRLARELVERLPESSENVRLLRECAHPEIRENRNTLIRNSRELCGYTGETRIGFIAKVVTGLF